jgi:hypothetical protein
MIDGRRFCFGIAYLGPLDDVEEAGVNFGADGHGSSEVLTINHSQVRDRSVRALSP